MFQILKGYLTDLTLCYNLVFLCSHSPMYGCRIAAMVCGIHVVEHGFHFGQSLWTFFCSRGVFIVRTNLVVVARFSLFQPIFSNRFHLSQSI